MGYNHRFLVHSLLYRRTKISYFPVLNPGNFFNIAWQLRHKEQKLLDGHLALAMIAPCLAGNLVGSIMNQLLPSTLIMILLLILAVTRLWKEVYKCLPGCFFNWSTALQIGAVYLNSGFVFECRFWNPIPAARSSNSSSNSNSNWQ